MSKTTPTERPILFSSPMSRAILDGRKTQTRRVVKPQPGRYEAGGGWGLTWNNKCKGGSDWLTKYCPYGQPGDRLWVRETWAPSEDIDCHNVIVYKAGGTRLIGSDGHSIQHGEHRCVSIVQAWKPSIHMPKWAARTWLEITDVRVQRLNEISEADAIAEGIAKLPATGRAVLAQGGQYFGDCWSTCRAAFQELWDSINGDRYPWANNDWVWAVSFRRVTP